MSTWVIYAAIASVVITAGLTWFLWRINEPLRREGRHRASGDGSVTASGDGGSGARGGKHDDNDSGGDSDGGGDGGGD